MVLEVIGVNMIEVRPVSVCGFTKLETMPTDACQIFYECVSCKTLLRPKQGDFCVFCFHGSVKMSTNAGRELHQLGNW
jgi:hypothetical protein